MTTDPKKNDEVKDEELDKVSGGTGDPIDRPVPKGDGDDSGGGGTLPGPGPYQMLTGR